MGSGCGEGDQRDLGQPRVAGDGEGDRLLDVGSIDSQAPSAKTRGALRRLSDSLE